MRKCGEGFSSIPEHTDVAVLIVTYNSADDVPALLRGLRGETRDQSIKVIVADNSPGPDTLLALAGHSDVLCFATGGNLGYAGAINAAMARAGSADAYLVLNPDMRVHPGAVKAMRRKMAAARAGVVVPLLLDADGSVYPSLRREPSVSRALGDAVMGSKFSGRPGWLSEMDFDDESYRYAHPVDWATGAALLIRADTAEVVGDWDEDYFLYSEETDFLRRVRAAGEKVWFEPRARMTHTRGGSGASPSLDALLAANRIRYIRKFHAAGYAHAFRAAVVLSALLRSPLPHGRGILSAVIQERRWSELPHAIVDAGKPDRGGFPQGSVIIPAHNEAAVIGRTLAALAGPMSGGGVEVIVACNGCSDATAAVARSFPGVRVIEIAEPSKVAALNAADLEATRWPRVYLDADIELPAEALRSTLEHLRGDEATLCARPAFTYDTRGADWLVSAYYRARNRLPQASGSMWGAGVYALSRRGHARLGKFPAVIADDGYVDRLYDEAEKATLNCPPVTVQTPRTARVLLRTLRRVYRGNAELVGMAGSHTGRTVRELFLTVRGPLSAADAVVYAAFAVAGRQASRRGTRWERDDSSRS
jgi:GT2 family glycosyltransferase